MREFGGFAGRNGDVVGEYRDRSQCLKRDEMGRDRNLELERRLEMMGSSLEKYGDGSQLRACGEKLTEKRDR